MQEIVLRPNETIELNPGESLAAGDELLLIRFDNTGGGGSGGSAGSGNNRWQNAETIIWETLKTQTGYQTGIYRQGDETRTVFAVPERIKPDSFGINDYTFTSSSRVFKIGVAELNGLVPKIGDTLEFNGETYIVRKTGASATCWQEIGNYGVMLRVFMTRYRTGPA